MNDVEEIFKNPEEKFYKSKTKLSKDIESLQQNGLIYLFISEGDCLFRPEIKPLSDCVIFIKWISYTGVIKIFKFIYKEVKYESISFN